MAEILMDKFLTETCFQKLCRYLREAGDAAKIKPSLSSAYQEFITLFPPNSLRNLTLEEYCVGRKDRTTFCWWLERGLQPVLGRYMPGTSRGHIIYFMPNGSVYKNRLLENLSDQAALEYTLKIQATIAEADITSDLSWIDDDNQLYSCAGVDPKVTIGDGRKLRLLAVYNPEVFLPISSSEHLGHFLILFGTKEEDLPSADRPFARSLMLRQIFLRAQQEVPDITPYGFMRALYATDLKPLKKIVSSSQDDEFLVEDEEVSMVVQPLNQILFGPPGTGKTYSTIDAALEILDSDFFAKNSQDRKALKDRFEEYVKNQHIRFVTFHQSFSYEDFVEGLGADAEDGQIRYEVKPGIFTQLCEAAVAKVVKKENVSVDVVKRRVWKMSLGNTLGDDAYIFDECIAENKILLGYGRLIDFAGCKNREDVFNAFIKAERHDVTRDSYDVTSVTTFVTKMQVGDLVVISEGNYKFRAIGEITSNYAFLNRDEQDDHYGQSRSVRWLRVYKPSLPYEQLLNKSFSQMTIYNLKDQVLDREKLSSLLENSSKLMNAADNTTPRVLIIDEINRGNISKIFGELITLIEPTKRAGEPEALEVILPYSKKPFSVPSNVYIVGTMNTSDRSLSGLDIALRRRFIFKEMPPKPELLDSVVAGINISKLLLVMNQRIEVLLGREYCLGHAYFMPLKNDSTVSDLANIFKRQIFPLLQEYFFEDWQRIQWVLNDHRKTEHQFVTRKSTNDLGDLFGSDVAIPDHQLPWVINEDAFTSAEAYQGIIQVKV